LSRRALLAAAAGSLAACAPRPERAITREDVAARYNNFYEFTGNKDVRRHVGRFRTDRWSVEVTGLVAKPRVWTLEEILRLPSEERIYRHRCVETWAMRVPWTGFPLSRLLRAAEPQHAARFVRFVTFAEPAQMPAIAARPWDHWPYTEGLRLDEAMHDLTLLVTGIYGHALPKQHGAPVRIVVPWKYGYKSPKSVVKIELVSEQPHTFWNDQAPVEYPFESNVNPSVPHPRWSQLSERLLGTWDVRRTLPFNGYGDQVAHLYV
ncbi:MAG: protein-methionine-sulfoxide reductase catalytic subunit MsrP, partial [Acidobacteriota bacterium]